MVHCISTLRSDPQLEPDMNTLSDMREIEVDFSTQGVSTMIEVMERTADKRSGARAAIVVGTDVAFGMGRMVELRSDERAEPNFRIFRDMLAASEWLGIE
jgi:hypothetical protein